MADTKNPPAVPGGEIVAESRAHLVERIRERAAADNPSWETRPKDRKCAICDSGYRVEDMYSGEWHWFAWEEYGMHHWRCTGCAGRYPNSWREFCGSLADDMEPVAGHGAQVPGLPFDARLIGP